MGVGYQSSDTAEVLPTLLADGTRVRDDGTRVLVDGTVVPAPPRRNPVTGERVADPPRDDTQDGFSYNVGVTWSPTQRLSFSLVGRNEISSSSAGDQSDVNLGQLSARYTPPGPISVSASVGYRDEESVNPSLEFDEDGNVIRTDEGSESFTAAGQINFTPAQRWYTAFASVSYEDDQSDLEQQSDDSVRVSAGLRLIY